MAVRFNDKDLINAFGLRNASVRGTELVCSCPFTENHKHGDSRPSFGIDLKHGLCHCFSCGYNGNVLSLASDLLGMPRLEAQQKFYGDISVNEITRMIYGESSERKEQTPLELDVSKWCPKDHPYWHERGFVSETIGEWMLGYDEVAMRVVVPIFFGGELVGWTKRAIDDYTKPKWEHSPGFKKSNILFGADRVAGDSLILVEAPLSVIMLWQYGIKNAVATFGADLSDEQALILRKISNRVLVYYDPDPAGVAGARRVISKLSNFQDVYIVQPTRDDPAAMSREENLEAIYKRPAIASWAY